MFSLNLVVILNLSLPFPAIISLLVSLVIHFQHHLFKFSFFFLSFFLFSFFFECSPHFSFLSSVSFFSFLCFFVCFFLFCYLHLFFLSFLCIFSFLLYISSFLWYSQFYPKRVIQIDWLQSSHKQVVQIFPHQQMSKSENWSNLVRALLAKLWSTTGWNFIS